MNTDSPAMAAALHGDLYMQIRTCVQMQSQYDIHLFTTDTWRGHVRNAHKLQKSWIKGFSLVKDSPFHLKAVTKVVLHNGMESNWVGLAFLSVCKALKRLNTGSCSAT